jgi:general stress protein 26
MRGEGSFRWSKPMTDAEFIDADERHHVERLLEAARRTIAEVRYCWVVTAAGDGRANARVVKAFPNGDGEDLWTRWFLTMRTGRKSAEIRAAGRVTLAYQNDSGDAYVTIAGPAEIVDEPCAVESRLQQVDDPGGALRGKLVAVKCTADHLELHIRGLTAEPWGHGRTLLARSRDGAWRFAA